MSEFTSHEWAVEETPNGAYVHANGVKVASCVWVFCAPGPSVTTEEARANARLISAAPPLPRQQGRQADGHA